MNLFTQTQTLTPKKHTSLPIFFTLAIVTIGITFSGTHSLMATEGDTLVAEAPAALPHEKQSTVADTTTLTMDQLCHFIGAVRDNKEIDEATNAAIQAMNSQNADVQEKALYLFVTLVKNGFAINEATAAAIQAIKIKNVLVQEGAVALLSALVENGFAINEAISAAIQSQNTDNKWIALFLFETLVKNGFAINEATTAAIQVINNQNPGDNGYGDHFNALLLFKTLVENGFAINEATSAAIQVMNSQNPMIQEMDLYLFETLIGKGVAINEATSAAIQAMNSQRAYLQEKASSLFGKLTAKGFVNIATATEAMNNENIDSQITALELFKIFVEKNLAIKEAIEASKKGLASKYESVRNKANVLFATILFASLGTKIQEK